MAADLIVALMLVDPTASAVWTPLTQDEEAAYSYSLGDGDGVGGARHAVLRRRPLGTDGRRDLGYSDLAMQIDCDAQTTVLLSVRMFDDDGAEAFSSVIPEEGRAPATVYADAPVDAPLFMAVCPDADALRSRRFQIVPRG